MSIIVGITIPAVLTTVDNTRKKALQVAAQSMDDWIDREYTAYLAGGDTSDTGLITVNPEFANLCIRTCKNAHCNGTKIGSRTDYHNAADAEPCNCNCDNRLIRLTSQFVTSAGIKADNVEVLPLTDSYTSGWRVKNGNLIEKNTESTLYTYR